MWAPLHRISTSLSKYALTLALRWAYGSNSGLGTPGGLSRLTRGLERTDRLFTEVRITSKSGHVTYLTGPATFTPWSGARVAGVPMSTLSCSVDTGPPGFPVSLPGEAGSIASVGVRFYRTDSTAVANPFPERSST